VAQHQNRAHARLALARSIEERLGLRAGRPGLGETISQ
jgi:hypothetical protein